MLVEKKKRQAIKQLKCLMVNSRLPYGKNKVSLVVISIRERKVTLIRLK